MANLVARLLEKRIAHLFENFEAGKNVTSSLLKGEGTAKDLQFNRNFINNLLPRTFCTTNATCKLLKWQVSLRTLGKAPISLVISGVNITIQQLPPGQARPPKSKAKQKKKGNKTSSKRNAILQGIKVQLTEVSFRIQLVPPPASMGPAAQESPFLLVSLSSFRIHSTNSQWQEVGELSKVHVVNPSTDEALSFKKLEVVGCTLIVLDTTPIPFSQSPPKACMVFDDLRVLGKISTKRRGTDWEVLAFKVDVEMPEVKISLSRRELYMIRNFARALTAISAKHTAASHQRNLSTSSFSDGAEEEEREEDWEVEDVAEAEGDSLDSILESQGSNAWTDSDTRWCSHIDNSLHFYLKQVDVQAKEDEDKADSACFLIVAANLQAKLWPAQNSLIKTVTGRPEHVAELSARSVTIEEIEGPAQRSAKLPQHRVFLRPSGAKDASEPQPLFFASVQFVPVPKNEKAAAASGASPTPPAIKVRLGGFTAVVDALVWMRFLRCFKGSSIDKALRTKKEKKKTKLGGESLQPSFNIEADAITITSPVNIEVNSTSAAGSFRAATKVSEMIFNIGGLSIQKKPASRYEWMLGGGLFAPSASSFPVARGDYRPASVAFSRQSVCDAVKGELEHISLTFSRDVNEAKMEVVKVQCFRFGIATNRRWETASPPFHFPKEEIWIEFEGGPEVIWGMHETAHVLSVYHNYFYGPQAQAIRDEEDQARHMIAALQAAQTGASNFSTEGKDGAAKNADGGFDRFPSDSLASSEVVRAIGLRMNGVKVRFYAVGEHTGDGAVAGTGSFRRRGEAAPNGNGATKAERAGSFRDGGARSGAEAVVLSKMLDVMVEMTHRSGTREKAVALRGKCFGFFFAVDHARHEEVPARSGEEVLAFRVERHHGGAVDVDGKPLAASLVVVQLERATVKVDLQRVQELKRAVLNTKKEMRRETHIKRAKEQGPGAKFRKGAKSVGKSILAGFHALVELSACSITVSSLSPHNSWPVTFSNQGLVLHNRAERDAPEWRGFGSPLSLCVRGRQGDDRNSIPAVDELVRARRSQEQVLAELEALETKFAVGPLRTVEAAVASTPGDHIHELTRMQMGDYLSELQAARHRISDALYHAAASPASRPPAPDRRGAEQPTLSDVQRSVAYTRICLQELQGLMEEEEGETSAREGRASSGFGFQVSEDCKLSLGVDAHEMIEMFEAFCAGPFLQHEYDMLFGVDG